MPLSEKSVVNTNLSAESRRELKALLLDISARIERLETSQNVNRLARSGSRLKYNRGRKRSRNRSRASNASGLCWYHETFAGKALKCKKSCSWQGNR
jgi:hypothetical protein